MDFRTKTTIDFSKLTGRKFRTDIKVGYAESDYHEPSGMAMSDIAKMMSVGTDTIPARPHLREGLEFGREDIKRAIKRYSGGFLKRAKPDEIAKVMRQSIQAYVFSGALVPNAPRTVKNKGFDQPLIETGELLSHLTTVIKRSQE